MTLTIWKFPIEIKDDIQEIEMPSPAIPLTFQMQKSNEVPTLWCLVDPEMGMVKKKFRVAGTGHKIDNSLEELKYIDTVQLLHGMLVYHLFEIVS